MDGFYFLSIHEDLNSMAAALPSCPMRLNPIPVSTSTKLSVAHTQSSWITTTAPIMYSWANPPCIRAPWPGSLTQSIPAVRHYSPVKFEDDQCRRSSSSRASSCSPARTSLNVPKKHNLSSKAESSGQEYGKIRKPRFHSAGQHTTPSSKKNSGMVNKVILVDNGSW
ncbi:hypothetical protein DPMN_194650 [Dreissena polymorpha]|uniref:Uncharacterized protein n=1 Tax=Dreissena polymorpha TaxID=45954 RepID=A0A9D3Y0H9_DREPO|nr:hypothetical protein DPMN_194650 [Dreissena polymorpha]